MPSSNPKPENQRFMELPESVFWGLSGEQAAPAAVESGIGSVTPSLVPVTEAVVTEKPLLSDVVTSDTDSGKPRFRRAIAGIEELLAAGPPKGSQELPVEPPIIPTPRPHKLKPHPAVPQTAGHVIMPLPSAVDVLDTNLLSTTASDSLPDEELTADEYGREKGLGWGIYKTHHLVLGAAALALVTGVVSYSHYVRQQAVAIGTSAKPSSASRPSHNTAAKTTPSVSHKATPLPLPTSLLDCKKPLLEFRVSTTASVDVPVHQLDGSVASFQFSDTKLAPRAQLLTNVALAACGGSANSLQVNGKTETVSRDAITIAPLFAKITPGSTTTIESVQRLSATSKGLAASTKVSPTEAALVNSWLLPNGSAQVAYGQTVDVEMHEAAAQALSVTNANVIAQTTDAAIRAELEAFAKKHGITGLSIVFTGSYPSGATNYQQVASQFKRLPISLFNTPTNHPIFGSTQLKAAGVKP